MKNIILSIFLVAIAAFTAVSVSASGEAYEVSLDTGIEVYSVYMCYEVKNSNVSTVNVDFADSVKVYGYSNYVNNKIWISIASGSPIDCSSVLANITVVSDGGKEETPDLLMSLLKINGVEISTAEFHPTSVTAQKTGNNINFSVNVHDELLRDNICIYAALYKESGEMTDVKIMKSNPESADETYSSAFLGVKDETTVKVFFMKGVFSPIVVPLECKVSEEA